MITSQQIIQIIRDGIEPTEPVDTILRVLRENDGKQYGKRFIAELKKIGIDARDVRQYGMTSLSFFLADRWQSLLISYETKNVLIDAQKIYNNNPAYFSARDERNRRRHNLLADVENFDALAKAANEYLAAKEKLQGLLGTMTDMPDYYRIRELCGFEN